MTAALAKKPAEVPAPAPAPQPSEGGSYSRDPITHELQRAPADQAE